MNYFVYLLINTNTKRKITYVGYTNNLTKRINLHNDGKGAKFTRGRNWKLIFFKKYDNKKTAMKEEYRFKKNSSLRRMIKTNYLNKQEVF